MNEPENKQDVKAILARHGLAGDDAEALAGPLVELGRETPRLSEEEVASIVHQAVAEFIRVHEHRFGSRGSHKHKEAYDTIARVSREIAIGVVSSGIWELLVYVWTHVVLHAASAGEDWDAEDAARAMAFRPTQNLAVASRDLLKKHTGDLYQWRQEYMQDITESLKWDPTLVQVAETVAKAEGWDAHLTNVFFYQWLANGVYSSLVAFGARKSLALPA